MQSSVFRPIFGSQRYGADAYLEQHHIIEMFWDAVKFVVEQRPLNPYPILVQYFQRHELWQSLSLHITDDDLVQGVRLSVSEIRENGVALYHASDTTLYWTLSDKLMAYIDLTYLRQLHAEIDDILQLYRFEDNEIKLDAIPSIAASSVFSRSLVRDTRRIKISRDVFVTGRRFESAVTCFAKFILQDLISLQNKTAHEFEGVVIDGSTYWNLGQIYANRNVFFKDLKRCTVANVPICARCVFGRETLLRLGQIRYVCHYRQAPASPLQSFDTIGSRSAHLNVFVSRAQVELYAALGPGRDLAQFRRQFHDEFRASQRQRFRAGKYYALLVSGVTATLLVDSTPSQQMVALFARLNRSLPGSLQTALALLLPCAASSSSASGGFASSQAGQYARAAEYVRQLVQVPLSSELVVLAPWLNENLRRRRTPAISTAIAALQDSVTVHVLRLYPDLARALHDGFADAAAPKSATVDVLLGVDAVVVQSDAVVDLDALSADHQLAIVQYLVDFGIDLAYRDTVLALTRDGLSPFPYAKLVAMFTQEALRVAAASVGDAPRGTPSLLPCAGLEGVHALVDIDTDRVVLGTEPALAWCQVADLTALHDLLMKSGVVPAHSTCVLYGPACLVGAVVTRVHDVHAHVTFEVVADRFETAVADFSVALINHVDSCQRHLPGVAGVEIGAQSWTMAQWQQGPEFVRAAIRAAVMAREPIALNAFVDDGDLVAIQIRFDLLYVNRQSERSAASSPVPARTLYEAVAVDDDAAARFFRPRAFHRDHALQELHAALPGAGPNQAVATLATLAILDADPALATDLRTYRGSTPERLQSCLAEFCVLRRGLRIGALRARCVTQLASWRNRVRDVVADDGAVHAIAVRRRLLVAIDDLIARPDPLVGDEIVADIDLLCWSAMGEYTAGRGRVRSWIAP